jgi:CRP-like cAMP-binding protein
MLDKSVLEKFKFFADLTEDRLEEIAKIGELHTFEPGDTIFQIEDASEHLFGVVDGAVEMRLIFEEKILRPVIKYEEVNRSYIEILKKPIQVASVTPGKIFGWSALVSSRIRTVTAQCAQASTLIALPADGLRDLFAKDPTLGYLLMSRLCDIVAQRLKNRTEKLIEAWGEAFELDEI